MLFSLTNPEVAILMMGIFLFAVLLGFPIAFTLMAMGIGFGYYAYYDAVLMDHIFDNRIFQLFVQNTYIVIHNCVSILNKKLKYSIIKYVLHHGSIIISKITKPNSHRHQCESNRKT